MAVNLDASRAALRLKLGVERLAVGAGAGIADAVVFRVDFNHILREASQTTILTGRWRNSGVTRSLIPFSTLL
jgi:hypothetical protein